MIPGVKINTEKSKRRERKRSWRVWSALKFLGSKEHLDWLKIDLNAAEIFIIQYYKRTKNSGKCQTGNI